MLLSSWLSLFELVPPRKSSCGESKDQDYHLYNADSLRNHSITLTLKCHWTGCRQSGKDNRIFMIGLGKSWYMARGWILLSLGRQYIPYPTTQLYVPNLCIVWPVLSQTREERAVTHLAADFLWYLTFVYSV